MNNLIEVFKETYYDAGSALLNSINEGKLEDIRNNYASLIQQWQSVPERESLKLIFEE
jgi:hypothetical protein